MAPTRAKIVATVGPASESGETICRLIEAGVSVFRLNFSHGTAESHAERVRTIRGASERLGRSVAILGDLPGPKIRVGVLERGVEVAPGDDVWLVGEGEERPEGLALPTTYALLAREVLPGQRVLIADGMIRLLAIEREGEALRCRVTVGGTITSGKGINVPECELSAPALGERDWAYVDWAIAHDLDFLAMSFVRRAEEVRELREHLARVCPLDGARDAVAWGACIPVVAKIEKPQALDRLDEIVREADAIMVARGDLGVEMDVARVPIAQKRIIESAARWGKPCIVATQMLESMTQSVTPTRAEASDVANAVLDGADGVMLSGETATGEHPVLVVETMRRIVAAAEDLALGATRAPSPPEGLREARDPVAAIGHGAWHVAQDVGAAAVVCWSENGGTARLLSQNAFAAPIFAYSSSERMTRRMALFSGVTAIREAPPARGSFGAWVRSVEGMLVSRGLAARGDRVVLVAGKPLGRPRSASAIVIHEIGRDDAWAGGPV